MHCIISTVDGRQRRRQVYRVRSPGRVATGHEGGGREEGCLLPTMSRSGENVWTFALKMVHFGAC